MTGGHAPQPLLDPPLSVADTDLFNSMHIPDVTKDYKILRRIIQTVKFAVYIQTYSVCIYVAVRALKVTIRGRFCADTTSIVQKWELIPLVVL